MGLYVFIQPYVRLCWADQSRFDLSPDPFHDAFSRGVKEHQASGLVAPWTWHGQD